VGAGSQTTEASRQRLTLTIVATNTHIRARKVAIVATDAYARAANATNRP
jgi:hypothetical protein